MHRVNPAIEILKGIGIGILVSAGALALSIPLAGIDCYLAPACNL